MAAVGAFSRTFVTRHAAEIRGKCGGVSDASRDAAHVRAIPHDHVRGAGSVRNDTAVHLSHGACAQKVLQRTGIAELDGYELEIMQVPTADRELAPVAGQAHAGIAARPQVDTRSWAGIGLGAAADVRLEPAVQLEPRPRAAAQILRAGKDDARRLVGNACLVVVGSRGSCGIARPQFVHFKTVLYLRSEEHTS